MATAMAPPARQTVPLPRIRLPYDRPFVPCLPFAPLPRSPFSRQEGVVAGDLVPPHGLAAAVQLDHGALGIDGTHEVAVPHLGEDAGGDGARSAPEAVAFQVEFLGHA